MRSAVPLVLRRTPEAVYLVGAAGGPLGGDLLALRISVLAGAFLRLRTAAASIALPGLDDAESRLTVTASVEPGGRLEYLPEPLVVSSRARHVSDFRVTLAEGASLVLRDELILGRHGEPGGSACTSLCVSYGGRPLLRQALSVSGCDEAALGPAVLAGHRAVGSLLTAGSSVSRPPSPLSSLSMGGSRPPSPLATSRAVMPLSGPGVLVTALADDAVSLRRRLEG
jgi:urease accessory protein